jgi:hypothetical protein
MQIKTISVSCRKKFNTGNYESVDLEVCLNADIGADENESDVTQYLILFCKDEIKKAAPPCYKNKFSIEQKVA